MPADASTAPRSTHPRALGRAAPWLLPAALFLLAFAFHGFDLGKYQDDYMLSMIDPATGRIDLSYHPFWDWSYFHRPLHFFTTSIYGTLLYDHDRLAHALGAAAHALSALLLFRLLRRLRVGPGAAGAAALLYVVYPLHAEKVFWITATSLSVGACVALWAMLIAARGASGAARARPLLVGVASFAAVAFYEQLGALVAVVPLVCLAARPAREPLRAGVRRALAPTLAAGLACVLNVALLVGTAPPGERGSVASLPEPESLWVRIVALARGVCFVMIGDRWSGFTLGALRTGWRELSNGSGRVWLVGVAVCAAIAAQRWMRPGHEDVGNAPRRATIAMAGLAAFVLAWAPLLGVKGHTVEPRLTSIPAVGLAMLIAAVLDAVLTGSPRPLRAPARVIAGAVVLALASAGAVALAGAQSLFRASSRTDERTLRQLMAAFPSPPHATFFMPLRSNVRLGDTGRVWFDEALQPGLGEPWSSWAVVRHFYRRRDLHATNFNTHGRWAPLEGHGADGVWYGLTGLDDPTQDRAAGPWPPGKVFVPWDSAIPFTIARDGGVSFVRELRIERTDGRDLTIIPPLVARARPGTPTRVFTHHEPTGLVARRDELWRLDAAGADLGPAPWTIAWEDGLQRASVELAPTPTDAPVRVAAVVSASDLPRTAVFRVSAPPGAAPTPIRAVVELTTAAGTRTTLAHATLSPAALAADRRWTPVIAPLPPTCDGDVLSIRFEPLGGRTTPASTTPLRVSPAWLLEDPRADRPLARIRG